MKKGKNEIEAIGRLAEVLLPIIKDVHALKGPFVSGQLYFPLASRGLSRGDFKKCLQILEGNGEIVVKNNIIYLSEL